MLKDFFNALFLIYKLDILHHLYYTENCGQNILQQLIFCVPKEEKKKNWFSNVIESKTKGINQDKFLQIWSMALT